MCWMVTICGVGRCLNDRFPRPERRLYHRPMRSRMLAVFCAAAASLLAQNQTPIENDQVRVVVVTDKPHSKSSPHEHKLNRVMVYLQPGRQEITPQNGPKQTLE